MDCWWFAIGIHNNIDFVVPQAFAMESDVHFPICEILPVCYHEC